MHFPFSDRFRSMLPFTGRTAMRVGLATLLLPALLAAQGKQPPAKKSPPPVRRDTLSDSIKAIMRATQRQAREETRRRLESDSTSIRARGEAGAVTAFKDDGAREILRRAREARLRQDSSLKAYRAKATQRITMKLGLRKTGMEKLLFQTDNVAHVAWQRNVGVWITPIGSRATIPMASEASGNIVGFVSVPYFPGREQLWIPSSESAISKSDIDEGDIIHPLARGAEAFYKYERGDSLDLTIAAGKVIHIRELRITARKPKWNLIVGSFWFDIDSGLLVRAAYRLAVDIDVWDLVSETTKRDADFNKELAKVRDSLMRANVPRDVYVRDSTSRSRNGSSDDDAPAWVKAMFRPAEAKLDAITIEFGLFEGRYWLPVSHTATASAQMGFIRAPLEFYEKYTYEMVNGSADLPPLPPPRTSRSGANVETGAGASVSASIGGSVPDSVRRAQQQRADSITAARDTLGITRASQCKRDSTYVRTETRYNGAVRIAYRMPCDQEKLEHSAELPPVYASSDSVFDAAARDDLLKLLDLDLQPGWAPEFPHLRTGIDLLRYNRVEGFSAGLLATENLGSGYTLSATGRIGHEDLHVNGEFTGARTNGRRVVHATAYHRLSSVNPEWSGALSWGPSLPALIYARDEGFYYRNFGFELGDHRESVGGMLDYRLFFERQWTAGDTTVMHTFNLSGRRFLPNIIAEPASLTGVSGQYMHSFAGSGGGTLATIVRAEAATGTFEFGRLALEGTGNKVIGPIALSLNGSIGSSVGRVPLQRLWYMGGLNTVRGQVAGTQAGNAYWLTRGEIGTRQGWLRPVLFYDMGWAGSRSLFGDSKPQRGAGIGASLLDGMFRIDFARGLYPTKQWKTDVYLQARL